MSSHSDLNNGSPDVLLIYLLIFLNKRNHGRINKDFDGCLYNRLTVERKERGRDTKHKQYVKVARQKEAVKERAISER